MQIVLASASSIRRSLMEQAGISHVVDPAQVQETQIKEKLKGSDSTLALALAEAKTVDVSRRRHEDWVIGADSLISVGSHRFAKPESREEAEAHLRFFSGKIMILTSAVALGRSGKIDWNFVGQATLHVRSLSDDFIQSYLETEWPEVGSCVGVFRMEGYGVNLFDEIEGDHFTILGMPLLPLMGALRSRGLLPS